MGPERDATLRNISHTIGIYRGVTLSLSDRCIVLIVESRASARALHTNRHTFGNLRNLRASHPRVSPKVSPMVSHPPATSRRDGDTEPELCGSEQGGPREARLACIWRDSMATMVHPADMQGSLPSHHTQGLSTFCMIPALSPKGGGETID